MSYASCFDCGTDPAYAIWIAFTVGTRHRVEHRIGPGGAPPAVTERASIWHVRRFIGLGRFVFFSVGISPTICRFVFVRDETSVTFSTTGAARQGICEVWGRVCGDVYFHICRSRP